jgi:hypothetical protein
MYGCPPFRRGSDIDSTVVQSDEVTNFLEWCTATDLRKYTQHASSYSSCRTHQQCSSKRSTFSFQFYGVTKEALQISHVKFCMDIPYVHSGHSYNKHVYP